MAYTVFVTAPKLHPAGVQLLQEQGARIIYLDDPDDARQVERIMAAEPVDAVISRTVELSARAISSCPALKVISKHGVGVSNIDVAAATARGIPVYMTPGANSASVAEMTIGLMIAAARHVPAMDRSLRQGKWNRMQDGRQLGGRTLGLVGFGQIGQRVARAALALEMNVLAYDPALADVALPVAGVTRAASLQELLPRADVLSLHIPLNARTRGLIGAPQLASLPAGAIVVNTARGGVIDEAALAAALRSGHLHAAGLDTTEQEPLPGDSPLLALPNIVITPHVGGSTPSALSLMASGAARNALDWLAGQPPAASSCVNPQVLEARPR